MSSQPPFLLTEDDFEIYGERVKLDIWLKKWEMEEILSNQEKAEKWDKLIESFTYDFEPVDDIEKIARQFIDNEVRTTHKLYEENKRLKEMVEKLQNT